MRSGCMGLFGRNPRLLMALVVAAVGIFGYFRLPKEMNPFTGQEARHQISEQQEVALGLESVPEMSQQFGGEVADPRLQAQINAIGQKLLAAKESILKKRGQEDYEYPFKFHVLADDKTINAFALPGGQVFITMALLRQLPNEDAVAGVIGHEIGHVLARHSSKQMATSGMLSKVMNAAVIATSDGSSAGQSRIAQYVGTFLQSKYSREDESESDRIGVQLLLEAGYKPEELLSVMKVLKASMNGPRPPEMLSTHPFPETRERGIEEYIKFFRANGAHADWKAG